MAFAGASAPHQPKLRQTASCYRLARAIPARRGSTQTDGLRSYANGASPPAEWRSVICVKTHRFAYTTRRGEQSAESFEFRNDMEAISCAGSLLGGDIISVAVRRHTSPGLERVGLWVMKHGVREWRPGE